MRADASLQVDLGLNDSQDEWALALAEQLSSDVDRMSSSSNSIQQKELPEQREEARDEIGHSNSPASATGSGYVASDGGGAEAPAVSSIANSTADQTPIRQVCDRGQWIPDEPIFFLLKVPRLQTA